MNHLQDLTKRNNDRIAAEQEAVRKEAERKYNEKLAAREAEARIADEEGKKSPPVAFESIEEIQVCKSGINFFLLLRDRATGAPRAYVLRETGKGQVNFPVENGNFYNAFETAFTAYKTRIFSGNVIV